MNMKKILAIFIVSCGFMLSAVLRANPDKSPQAAYIERYSALAVEEMYRSGIPASITLAQGLLESRYGLSELAVEANNHFGIKCHNWAGAKMFYDDDKKNECFRKYASAEDSFRDHSDFLRYRDRYKFLFDLDPTDYEGWAHGLRKAGYATDPSYPQKLIRLIEDYDLHRFDSLKKSPEEVADNEDVKLSKEERRALKKERKMARKEAQRELPESPNSIEQPKPLHKDHKETFRFNMSRQMYSQNGVPFVYAAEGDTFAGIAETYGLFLKEILRYNDLDDISVLKPGQVVYIQPKKKQAAHGLEKYIAENDGEILWEISQRFAVKLESLCKLNHISEEYVLREGEVLKLRK
jgi:hypothetical protein